MPQNRMPDQIEMEKSENHEPYNHCSFHASEGCNQSSLHVHADRINAQTEELLETETPIAV